MTAKTPAVSQSQGRTCYSIEEVARQNGLSSNFIRKLIGRREIATTRVGRRVLIPAASWQRYLDKNTTPAARH